MFPKRKKTNTSKICRPSSTKYYRIISVSFFFYYPTSYRPDLLPHKVAQFVWNMPRSSQRDVRNSIYQIRFLFSCIVRILIRFYSGDANTGSFCSAAARLRIQFPSFLRYMYVIHKSFMDLAEVRLHSRYAFVSKNNYFTRTFFWAHPYRVLKRPRIR